MMDKPLTVRRNECIERICAVINEAQLPAFASADIMERILAELRKLAEIEYQQDLKRYNDAQRGEAE